MNRSTQINESLLDDMQTNVAGARTAIRKSTTVLRRSYQKDTSNATPETLIYRRRLYSEGIMYGTRVYPRTVEIIKAVKRILEYYLYLDYSDFAECVDEVRAECLKYAKDSLNSQHRHTYVLANIKELQDEMFRAQDGLKKRERVYLQNAEGHEAKSSAGLIGAQAAIITSDAVTNTLATTAEKYGVS